jgi:chemotaxis protein MotB
MRFLVLGLAAAALFVFGPGCVPVWDHVDLLNAFNADKKIIEELNKAVSALGPENTELRKLIEDLRIDRDKYMQMYASIKGVVESEEWQKLMKDDLPKQLDKIRTTPTPDILDDDLKSSIRLYPDEKGIIGLSQELLFDPGSATVKKSAKPVIKKLADIFIKKEYSRAIIRIEGHTDTQQVKHHLEMENNWKLSALRAYAVLMAFKEAGVPDSKLCGMFWGEWNPRVPTKTNTAEAKNRRVEIKLIERPVKGGNSAPEEAPMPESTPK